MRSFDALMYRVSNLDRHRRVRRNGHLSVTIMTHIADLKHFRKAGKLRGLSRNLAQETTHSPPIGVSCIDCMSSKEQRKYLHHASGLHDLCHAKTDIRRNLYLRASTTPITGASRNRRLWEIQPLLPTAVMKKIGRARGIRRFKHAHRKRNNRPDKIIYTDVCPIP